MSDRWREEPDPGLGGIGPLGWGLVLGRGLMLIALVFIGLVLVLAVRLLERPLFGVRRPVSPFITQMVCRAALLVLGIGFRTRGAPMRGEGAVVANHSSWLDIFVLNARKRIYFVSKSEVAAWPGIGWLARATGTVFINRAARDALVQREIFETRLAAGHKLLFFPEGTSTDSLRVLAFKSTLFAAFFTQGLREKLQVQPVSVVYRAPRGKPANFYGWWGDMLFGPHLIKTMASWRQGSVEVTYHSAVQVSDFSDRKSLAKYCETQVRSVFDA